LIAAIAGRSLKNRSGDGLLCGTDFDDRYFWIGSISRIRRVDSNDRDVSTVNLQAMDLCVGGRPLADIQRRGEERT
jgi:hypothetical protein